MQSTVWLAVILLAWASAQQVGAQEEPAKKPLPAVSVHTIGPAAAGRGARYSAELQPFKQVDVAFKVGGYIQEILQVRGTDGQQRHVQEGDRVVKGTVLARVREIDYVVKRDEARAQLAEAQAARAQQAQAQASEAGVKAQSQGTQARVEGLRE